MLREVLGNDSIRQKLSRLTHLLVVLLVPLRESPFARDHNLSHCVLDMNKKAGHGQKQADLLPTRELELGSPKSFKTRRLMLFFGTE